MFTNVTVIVEDDSEGDLYCWVYNYPPSMMGDAHQCVSCKKNVNLICGEIIDIQKDSRCLREI